MSLDLDRRRDLAAIIATTLDLFTKHFAVFISMTAIVIVPVKFLVDGVWGRVLFDGGDADSPLGATIASLALGSLVLGAIVSALHVRVVEAIGRGETPTVASAMRDAAPVINRVCLASALTVAITAAGFVLLIVPGVYLAIATAFTLQATVAENLRPVDAVRRSMDLVSDRWWMVFGYGIVFSALSFGLGGVLAIVDPLITNGPIAITCRLIGETISASVLALASTIFFFSLRTPRVVASTAADS